MRSLLVVLSLLIVLSSGCDMFGKKKRAEQAAIELKAKNDSIANAKKKAKALKIKKQKEEQARKDSIKKAEEARKKLYKFHVIVGSFKTPKYATAYNDFIGKKGYQTELISNKYGFQLVSIGGNKTWGEAIRELQKAREAIEETAWIYIRE
jgi:phosphotransferase system IIB component